MSINFCTEFSKAQVLPWELEVYSKLISASDVLGQIPKKVRTTK